MTAVRRSPPRGAQPSPQPDEIRPQLATATQRLEDKPWIFERKLDGIRLLVHVKDGQVRLQSRNQLPYADHFPELADEVRGGANANLIADGEVVAFDGSVTSFPLLQTRLGSPLRAGRRDHAPVHLYLFDLLYLDVHDLRPCRLLDRKDALAEAIDFGGRLRFTEHVRGDVDALRDLACRDRWEGLIAKLPDASYRAGRSTAWRKLPCLHSESFVVGGFTDASGSRAGFGALLVGEFHADGSLRYAGKVGTGFDQTELATIRSFMGRIEIGAPPFSDPPDERGCRWVQPIVVVRVTYAERTPRGRLRHPRFDGVLPGADPREVVRSLSR